MTLHLLEEGDIRTANPKTRKKLSAEEKSDKPDLVIVPKRLSNPDDLVSAAKANLLHTKYTHYRYKGLVSTDSNHLDINVTRPNIERALRFMDTLVKRIKEKGYLIEINHRGTYITIEEESLKITLREMFTREPSSKPHTFTEYKPTGVLCFTMDEFYPAQFKDGVEKIEERIPDIILRLEQRAQKHKESSEYHARMRAEREEADRIVREKQERKEKELADFKKLLNDAKRWKESMVIREYIQAIESGSVDTISEDRRAWIEWAKKKADWYDPTKKLEDEILKGYDKIFHLSALIEC